MRILVVGYGADCASILVETLPSLIGPLLLGDDFLIWQFLIIESQILVDQLCVNLLHIFLAALTPLTILGSFLGSTCRHFLIPTNGYIVDLSLSELVIDPSNPMLLHI